MTPTNMKYEWPIEDLDGRPIPLPPLLFRIRYRLRELWWSNWLRQAWIRFQQWRAERICARVGCDREGGSYRGEYGTAYWYRCKRCGDEATSE